MSKKLNELTNNNVFIRDEKLKYEFVYNYPYIPKELFDEILQPFDMDVEQEDVEYDGIAYLNPECYKYNDKLQTYIQYVVL